MLPYRISLAERAPRVEPGARATLMQGFGGVMLYGAVFTLGLSGLSVLVFGRRKAAIVDANDAPSLPRPLSPRPLSPNTPGR